MAEKTGKRKVDHIRICLDQKAQAKNVTAGFEDIQLVHRALPEINKAKISLSTTFLGKKFNAPIIVGAMTGGAKEAIQINASIAEAVEQLGLGMGLGSQRAAIENEKLEKTYSIARKKAPHAFLIANVGGVQLVHGYGLKEVKKIVEMIDADAVAIHLKRIAGSCAAGRANQFSRCTCENCRNRRCDRYSYYSKGNRGWDLS